MNKRFFLLYALCVAMVATLFANCKGDDEPDVPPVIPSEYLYVLNCGVMGSNNASLTLYDVEKGKVSQCIFEMQNGRRLGENGQDIIVYGSKMYIAMTEENTIEVTDLEAKSIKQIKTDGGPRYFTAHGGKVYVTYFNGYVARIDTTSLLVEAKTSVGRNPEQLTVANGKLYIANSGGLAFLTGEERDKTISVVDIGSFTETEKIVVIENPCNVVSDTKDHIYVVSKGNYEDIPNQLQKINIKNNEVSTVKSMNATHIATVGTKLYSIYSLYDENWKPECLFYVYDMVSNTVLSDNFTGTTRIVGDPLVSTDAESGEVYVTSASENYVNNGDVYIFDKSNQFVTKFEAGIMPMKAVKIRR